MKEKHDELLNSTTAFKSKNTLTRTPIQSCKNVDKNTETVESNNALNPCSNKNHF